MTAPSGAQHEIVHGDLRAVVVEVGGGLRGFWDGDREVLQSYPLDAMCDGAHGQPLVPWPNRLADGRYGFDGSTYQCALTEPDKHNAIHGFGLWRSWHAVQREASAVTMELRIKPMQGYPFDLAVRVDYRLGDGGLQVTTTAQNLGQAACPVGIGQHPYLSPGADAGVDECELRVDGATRVLTDDERQLPTGTEPVEGTAYDFRAPRRLGDLEVDYAFEDLARDGDGRAWAQLTGPDGRTAGLWVDDAYSLLEIFTGDTLSPQRRRTGVGVEPMTCPPNAFATGDRVIALEPGASTSATWGATLL
ncbi:MAG TPA: aldose 1-epimerase family protein [Angustibacter sp.]|nr:aldose 1-epimerase family protein [Angustibacter sp.]